MFRFHFSTFKFLFRLRNWICTPFPIPSRSFTLQTSKNLHSSLPPISRLLFSFYLLVQKYLTPLLKTNHPVFCFHLTCVPWGSTSSSFDCFHITSTGFVPYSFQSSRSYLRFKPSTIFILHSPFFFFFSLFISFFRFLLHFFILQHF